MDVRGLTGSRPEGRGPDAEIVHGYVSLQRPAPVSLDGVIYVIVPSHSSETPYGPLTFPASHGATLPIQGTPVVLAFGIALDATPRVPSVVSWDGPYTNPDIGA
jgi:hypothetical protein